jgi:uncharacterized lipoprotein YajG
MKLPISKIIQSKVYSKYDFEPWSKKIIQRGKWKKKLKCKNRQIRKVINRTLNNIIKEEL